MKKILTHLTGIGFLLAILIAGSCNRATTPKDGTDGNAGMAVVKPDSTIITIFLKDREILGTMHLEMSDSKKPQCPVIDNLETLVYPGDSVIWKKAKNSKIDEILHIRPVEKGGIIFPEEPTLDKSLFKIKIPENAIPGIEKYEIVFTVKNDTTIYTVDPYLKIP